MMKKTSPISATSATRRPIGGPAIAAEADVIDESALIDIGSVWMTAPLINRRLAVTRQRSAEHPANSQLVIN
jgi:hypothetical protein